MSAPSNEVARPIGPAPDSEAKWLLGLRKSLRRLRARATERAQRLQLLAATWQAGGCDDRCGIVTVRAELAGLAQEVRSVGLGVLADTIDDAAAALGSHQATRGEVEPHHAGRRILILDDSEVTRDVIALALEGTGCVVTVASSLAEYRTRVAEFQPEVLLLEPGHPELAGSSTFDKLRQRIDSSAVPVVLFSAESAPLLKKRAETLGVDGWVTKDQGTNELLEQVEEILGNILW